MADRDVERERARNLWESFARKHAALARSAQLDPAPDLDFDQIGGLEAPKEELLTYACAATNPEVYATWGTHPPSGLLLIGRAGVGKTLLARALATRTGTSFLQIRVPRLVLEMAHGTGRAGELLVAWPGFLEEMPALTVFFDELAYSEALEIAGPRAELPLAPIIDFLLAFVDRTAAVPGTLMVGSTSRPETLRYGFATPGRFERVVEVNPVFPDDVAAALRLHAASAEKRAGRNLFEGVDWTEVVRHNRELSPGEWIHLMHAVLRRKARCEAAGEEVKPVVTQDLLQEAERVRQTRTHLPSMGAGNYL